MDSQQMQAIGICRFSYPALGGFQVEHGSISEREAFLYDTTRLADRFRYFETITLPGLHAQTDPNFTFLVVIGENLPNTWRNRLMDGLSGLANVVVQPHAPGPHREVMKAAINAVRRSADAPVLQFRMDDDDAVSVQFIERLRHAAQDNAALIRKNRHVAIDFSKGYVACPTRNGIEARQVIETLWTPALAMSTGAGSHTTIMNFGHTRMGRFMPVVSLSEDSMFVRGHSDMNDSRQKTNVRQFPLTLLSKTEEDRFKETFAIDSDAVRAAFSTS